MKRFFWVIALVLGIIGFLTVWFFLPHRSEIDHPFQILFRITVFLCISLSVAFFPNKMSWGYLLLLIPLATFVGFVLPRTGYFGFFGAAMERPGDFYIHLYQLTYPAVMLSVCAALRIGGGTPGQVLKTAINGTLILFSGFLDVMFFIINPVDIPEVIGAAHHIALRLGRYPRYWEAIVLVVVHIPFIVGVTFIPFDRWAKKLGLLEQE